MWDPRAITEKSGDDKGNQNLTREGASCPKEEKNGEKRAQAAGEGWTQGGWNPYDRERRRLVCIRGGSLS